MTKQIFYLFIFLFFLTRAVFAEITIDHPDTRLFFGEDIEFYKDNNNLSLNDIMKMKAGWVHSDSHSFILGPQKAAYWIRFQLHNRTDRDIYLTLNTFNFDSIQVYLPDGEDNYVVKTGGDVYPFSHREIFNKDIIFSIPPSEKKQAYYVRLQTSLTMVFMPEIMTATKLSERSSKRLPLYWLYYGALLALIIYNLFIYFSVKDIRYLILIFIISSYLLFDLSLEGFGFMFIWPEFCYLQKIVIPLSVSMVGMSIPYFIQLMLETKKYHKFIHQGFNTIIIPHLIMAVLTFYFQKRIFQYQSIIIIYAAVASISLLSYVAFKKRNRSAVLLFIGCFLMLAPHLFTALSDVAFLNKNIPIMSNYLLSFGFIKIGSLCMFFMFSFSVADQINIMKKNLEISYDKLEKSEQTYRTIFNGAQEAICLLDADDYTVTDANDSMLKMFTMSYDEVLGKTAEDFSAVEDGYTTEKGMSYLEKLLQDDFVQFEWLYKTKADKKIWAEVSISKVQINGIDKYMAVMRDITEKKKAAEEHDKIMQHLSRTQKMEAVGTLAGGLAHDFNNILTGIMGSSSLLELLASEEELNKSKINKYIKIIKDTSFRAAGIIRRLLAVSKKVELKFETLNLNTAIKNVLDICINSFPKSIEIDINYLDQPARINADAGSIEQVFLNLFVNASHAMTIMQCPGEKKGGVITVTIERFTSDDAFCKAHEGAAPGSRYFAVSVRDNGCGMDEETISKIFDPFFTTKDVEDGTGLGLAMAYNIVKQHNGTIDVHSEEKNGTTFVVYLPEAAAEVKNETSLKEEVIEGQGTILIIDDEEQIRMIAGDILTESGYDILLAPDGKKGIDVFGRKHADIDAVLLDMSMPGLSGLETFQELKKIDPDCMVIVSSGHSIESGAQEALDLGAKKFVQKPYTVRQLSDAVREVLNK